MDISRSLENAGISSLRSVHQINRKSGQVDRLCVHLSPQVSHGRKPDKAGCPTMPERVKPSRVKGSLRRASPALDPFSGVTEPRSFDGSLRRVTRRGNLREHQVDADEAAQVPVSSENARPDLARVQGQDATAS